MLCKLLIYYLTALLVNIQIKIVQHVTLIIVTKS